jgi:FkbM family methyltransferase
MLKTLKNNLFGDKFTQLIKEAEKFPRYRQHVFNFGKYRFQVTDFLSVAWQIKEIFGDEELKFIPGTPNPVIVDCGANVGVVAIFFKILFPGAKVYSFEPDSRIFQCLENNLNYNSISGVTLYNKAVWIHNDKIAFGGDGADGGSLFSGSNQKEVSAIRLKEFLSELPEIDLLKMDIEGAEVDVLMDCRNSLSNVKRIFVEYHSFNNRKQELDELLKVLTENGFRYYIRSIVNSPMNPFINKLDPVMDIQLNIHAVRNESQG